MTDFTPIESQDVLDRIIGERLAREREKFADYDDLKALAQNTATAEEKATEWQTKYEELAGELVEARRVNIASEFGVPADLLVGTDVDAMRDHAEKIAALITASKTEPATSDEPEAPVAPVAPVVPRVGDQQPSPSPFASLGF